MGCPRKTQLGDNIIFGICTHDPDTGVLTDADSSPVFRVYEDENATPVAGGKMQKLDDANTTGFYTSQIACTQRNGFQVSKSYTIYIEATVDSDTGGMCYGFTVSQSPWMNIIVEGIDTMSVDFHQIVGRYKKR